MKLFSIAEAEADMKSLLVAAQKERIIITRSGKPSGMIIGVESYDEEDWRWASDPEFWAMIQERRRDNRNGIPLEKVKARITARERAERAAEKRKARNKAK